MTLEFEKLSAEVEEMGRSLIQLHQKRRTEIERLIERLKKASAERDFLHRCVQDVDELAKNKFRAALPYWDDEPLASGISPQAPPAIATLIAVDGSQILPDRHAPYTYSLINIGGILYHHGSGRAPTPFNKPTLRYPKITDPNNSAVFDATQVGIDRDLAEIGMLAEKAWDYRHDDDFCLAVMDQRLLYWPLDEASQQRNEKTAQKWQGSMTQVQDAGAALIGYLDRPGKGSVVSMLGAMGVGSAEFNLSTVTAHRIDLTDTHLFAELLQPGERSAVFTEFSPFNRRFADGGHRICFFYINPSTDGKAIARIDIPEWVAESRQNVEIIHALIIDQCRITGPYPYILARADEEAVVGKEDQAYLDNWIDLTMLRHDEYDASQTNKRSAKDDFRQKSGRHSL